MVTEGSRNTPPGPGVDASGQTTIDPTQNVRDLVDLQVKRLDDIAHIRADCRTEVDSLNIEHHREIRKINAIHSKELRDGEKERIDAIRAVDVGAVQRAAEVQQAAAAALANQTALLAETLRTQVATVQSAGVDALAAALDPIRKDIADLRQVQYEGAGVKVGSIEAANDPILKELVAMRHAIDQSSGATSQRQTSDDAGRSTLGLVIAAASVLSAGFLGVAAIVVTLLLR